MALRLGTSDRRSQIPFGVLIYGAAEGLRKSVGPIV
jgi:hypothetical protein